MRRAAAFIICIALAGPSFAADLSFTGRMEQGGLVLGAAPPGSVVQFNEQSFPVGADGRFLLGFDRDAPTIMAVNVTAPDGKVLTRTLSVEPRRWQIERVEGLPQRLVTPDPETAARMAEDSKLLRAAFARTETEPFFLSGFIRPAEGRVSGVFGSQRVLNGSPRAPHAGLDIAGGMGAPVRAAADGVVSLAKDDMVLTGQTVVIEHGYGLDSVYIHMSRIDVADGQRVKRGDVIGAIGMTGRANGPHLHFGVTWYGTRLDPETVLAVLAADSASVERAAQ